MDAEFATSLSHVHHGARNQVSRQVGLESVVARSVGERAAPVRRTVTVLAILVAVLYVGFIVMMGWR